MGRRIVLSPRDGVQPLEFNDEAYYSILGADLARTGTESIYSPSGFTEIVGLPPQTWYHWGELWLAAAVITVFGRRRSQARYFVVLPVLLLAAAALTGTLVRRMTGSASRAPSCSGSSPACSWRRCRSSRARSSAPGRSADLRDHDRTAWRRWRSCSRCTACGPRAGGRPPGPWPRSSAAPPRYRAGPHRDRGAGARRRRERLDHPHRRSSWRRDDCPIVAPVWRRTFVATGIASVATVAWGLLTGHGVGSSALSPSVSPFNASWRESVAITTLGAGAFLAIAVAWFMVRKERHRGRLYLGTVVLLCRRCARVGCAARRFNMFHLFFGGIAVFATPVAAVAVWSIWLRLRATSHTATGGRRAACCASSSSNSVSPWASSDCKASDQGDYPPSPGGPGRDSGLPAGRQARLRLPANRGGRVLGSATPRHRRPHRSSRRADVFPGRDFSAG